MMHYEVAGRIIEADDLGLSDHLNPGLGRYNTHRA
jgi:hypothetical protein